MLLFTNQSLFKRRFLSVTTQQLATIVHGLHTISDQYECYYQMLGIPENSDQAAVREAFIKLAKLHHPDGGHPQADAHIFQQIEQAYRILMKKFSEDRHNQQEIEGEFGLYYEQKKRQREQREKEIEKYMEEDDDDKDSGKMYSIKHKVPQHRQYLSYEGMGIGTPSQRQKQYTKFQALRATENVLDYKVQKLTSEHEESSLVAKDKSKARKIRTRYGMDRIVEDLIQESMARGDFDNLSCNGKPLSYQEHNPYLDTVSHKLNQVLIENGFSPEWVMLEREIREERDRIKKSLFKAREKIGQLPLSEDDQVTWQKSLVKMSEEIESLNTKISKYNLLVPIMNKQTVHYPLTRVAQEVLIEGRTKEDVSIEEKSQEIPLDSKEQVSGSISNDQGFFRLFKIFKPS